MNNLALSQRNLRGNLHWLTSVSITYSIRNYNKTSKNVSFIALSEKEMLSIIFTEAETPAIFSFLM